MVEDKTPAKKRKISGHQRMRLETVTRLQQLKIKSKKKKQMKKASAEADPDSMEITVSKHDENTKNSVQSQMAAVVRPRKPRIKTSVLKTPPLPVAKFRKRQVHKSWLPTHLYHTKRARMTPPKEPLWRFAMPLTPTEKSYRHTHRATTLRGAIAWDSSYMSTIGLEGPEKSIEGLLKAIGVGVERGSQALWGRTGTRWRRGLRVWNGWLFERDGWPGKAISPATIIWNPEVTAEKTRNTDLEGAAADQDTKKKIKRNIFIRVHPGGFLQLWEQVVRLAKVQKPSVTVEDLRFEIGSIEVTGPNSTEVLVGTINPIISTKDASETPKSAGDIWKSLASIPNPSILPKEALLSFEMSDPRLHHPPRTVFQEQDPNAQSDLLRLCAAWPLDKSNTSISLFNRNKRRRAARDLPSQKSINRRKSLAPPGEFPAANSTDPAIPTLLFTSQDGNGNQGSWTMMMPWKCVLPLWYPLMYYPMSTGQVARFGGLNERRQIAYESGNPWFPADYPGTKAGFEWELRERARTKAEWERKPKGRRIEWVSLDLGQGRKGEIGMGWACDWERLIKETEESNESPTLSHVPLSVASEQLRSRIMGEDMPNGLATTKISLVAKGAPQNRARVYRLPTDNVQLRQRWVSLLPDRGHKKATLKVGDISYPVVPDEIDLIGFVTTGNFNLAEGKATAIGSLLLRKIMPSNTTDGLQKVKGNLTKHSQPVLDNICIVRDAGEAVGRLARWTLV
jgi:ribonuclease P/MRP protein subunit POP1